MPKHSLIYLDMDGVCCDFFAAATRINGYDPSTVFATWAQHHRGEFYLYKVLGIDSDTFWDHIAEGGETFWRELGEYPWFAHMYGELKTRGKAVLVISHDERYFHLADRVLTLEEGKLVPAGRSPLPV